MAEIRFKENKLSIIFFLSDFLLLESVDIRSSHHLVEKLHRAIHRTLAENRFYFKTDNKSNQIKSNHLLGQYSIYVLKKHGKI